jgi:GNAT superfamily N-acetyltransferase
MQLGRRKTMRTRPATAEDCPLLASWNHQLIQDEGHRNPMTVPELEQRMRGWLRGEYVALLFLDGQAPVAYALYKESKTDIYLRQFFVARDRRREGIGRQAMRTLIDHVWPQGKRLLVEVLWHNKPAIAFWRAVGFAEYCLTLEILPHEP